jgi:hypothetical protein
MRVALVLVACLCLCDCATIVRGTTSTVGFDSVPSGAEVRTSLGPGCVTPCSLVISKKDEFIATFTKPGYAPEQVEVKHEVSQAGAGATTANVLLGGVIGLGVDAASGAVWEHVPNPVKVTLKPDVPTPSRAPAAARPRPPGT